MMYRRNLPLKALLITAFILTTCTPQAPLPPEAISTPTTIVVISPTNTTTHTSQPTQKPTNTPKPTLEPPSIEGRVTIAASGEMLPNATVEVRDAADNQKFIASSSTDESGYYRFDEIPEGEYYTVAYAEGYAREIYDQATAIQEAAVIQFNGTPIIGIDFALNEGGAITGRVTTDETKPVANARIYAIEAKYTWVDVMEYETITGSEGIYEISNLPLGEYTIVVAEPGYVQEFYQNSHYLSLFTPVEVRPPMITTDIDMNLDPEGRISGQVIDEKTGDPVKNAFVHLYPQGTHDAYTWGIVLKNEDDGSFSVGMLPPSQYLVSVRVDGFADEIYDHKPGWGTADLLDVKPGSEVGDVTVRMRKGGLVTGHLFDEHGKPLEGFLVDIQLPDTDHASAMPGHTQPDGSFSVHMPTGTYIAYTARVPGYIPKYYIDTYYPEGATTIKVDLDEDVSGIDITLELAGSISGVVYQSDGVTPVPDAQVYAFPLDEKVGAGATTDQNGFYIIEGIPSGQYRVEVKVPGSEQTFYYPGVTNEGEAISLNVTAPQVTSDIDIILQ